MTQGMMCAQAKKALEEATRLTQQGNAGMLGLCRRRRTARHLQESKRIESQDLVLFLGLSGEGVYLVLQEGALKTALFRLQGLRMIQEKPSVRQVKFNTPGLSI